MVFYKSIPELTLALYPCWAQSPIPPSRKGQSVEVTGCHQRYTTQYIMSHGILLPQCVEYYLYTLRSFMEIFKLRKDKHRHSEWEADRGTDSISERFLHFTFQVLQSTPPPTTIKWHHRNPRIRERLQWPPPLPPLINIDIISAMFADYLQNSIWLISPSVWPVDVSSFIHTLTGLNTGNQLCHQPQKKQPKSSDSVERLLTCC